MAGSQYQENHRVVSYECDKQGNMTMPMLMNVAILCSEHHLNELGLDDEFVHSFDVGWVVTEYEITIERMPKLEELVTVQTEAVSYNKFFCYRDFNVYDANGAVLVTIHSSFVLMSFETRKIVRAIPEIVDRFECDYVTRVQRLPKMETINVPAGTKEYRVRYFDIDSNQHVNNVHYFEWMLDHLGFDFLISHQIKKFQIKFEQEVAYGNMITSHFEQREANTESPTTLHQIKNDDVVCAEAQVTWVAY